MPRVMIHNYDVFYDVKTEVQFSRVLDRRTNCYIGVAQVSKTIAKVYAGRPDRFRILSDEEWKQINEGVAETADESVADSETGDPLLDAAAAVNGGQTPLSPLSGAPVPPGGGS